MPLYEYSCRACDKQFTFLKGVVADNDEPTCPRCQSRDLQKLMSRFRRGRSEDERMEAVAERMETKDLDDPQVARRFAREMGREMEGETGESFSDELEELMNEEMHDDAIGGSSSSNSDDGTIY
jgi:putative FmdB family regulatory protein